jgi:hypothetical protein
MLLAVNLQTTSFISAQTADLLSAIYIADYSKPLIFSESCLLNTLNEVRKRSTQEPAF